MPAKGRRTRRTPTKRSVEESKTEADNPYGTEEDEYENYGTDDDDIEEEEEEEDEDDYDDDDADDDDNFQDDDDQYEVVDDDDDDEDYDIEEDSTGSKQNGSRKNRRRSIRFKETDESAKEIEIQDDRKRALPEDNNGTTIEDATPEDCKTEAPAISLEEKKIASTDADDNNLEETNETADLINDEKSPAKRKQKNPPVVLDTIPKSSLKEKSSIPRKKPKPTQSRPPPPINYQFYPLKFEARPGKQHIDEYALKMICYVCEQTEIKTAYRCLDQPTPALGYTLETEPDRLKKMRLNLRQRFENANNHGITAVAFADRLMRLWGGSLIVSVSEEEKAAKKKAEAEAALLASTSPAAPSDCEHLAKDAKAEVGNSVDNTTLEQGNGQVDDASGVADPTVDQILNNIEEQNNDD